MERIQLPVRGMVFDAVAAGPPDGDLVMLLHGFPQTSHCWSAIAPTLAEAGFRAVAPDQRGYSPGARPAGVDAYRSPELAADVVAMAELLGAERFHVVGHDWGAMVTWQLAGRHGDRLLSATALSVPHPLAFAEALVGGDRSDQAKRSSYIDFFRAEGSEDGMLANDAAGLRGVFAASGMSEEQAAPYLEALGEPEALRAALNWYRAMDLSGAQGLDPITIPVLFIWSTADPAIGKAAADACGRYVEGPFRYEVLEGVSHWIPEQAPAEVSRLLLEHLAPS